MKLLKFEMKWEISEMCVFWNNVCIIYSFPIMLDQS